MARAIRHIVEKKNADDEWEWLPNAACTEIVLNPGAKPSTARIVIPNAPWHDTEDLDLEDVVRVRSDAETIEKSTLFFYGVLTARTPHFAGGGVRSQGTEQPSFLAQCPKYVLSKPRVVFGQYCLQVAAYPATEADWASGPPTPTDTTKYVLCDTRRCIFNENGAANKAPSDSYSTIGGFSIPNFGYLNAEPWNAGEIIRYLLGGYSSVTAAWKPADDPADAVGLDDSDWDVTLQHVNCEKLTMMEAVEYVAGRIGWLYRLDWYLSGNTIALTHIFYKPGETTRRKRAAFNPTILHTLYGSTADDLQTDLEADRSVPHAGNLLFDIAPVVNKAYIRGAPIVDEITVELVPAWQDSLMGWAVDDDTNKLWYEDHEITTMLEAGSDPNSFTYFTRHHIVGNSFATYRNVGRRWALNEIGTYSTTAYDRGTPTDIAALITSLTTARLGFWPRSIGECLAKDGDNHVPYYLEFSVDAGTTWHPLHNYAIQLLPNEWGIWIAEANLANIKMSNATTEGSNNVFSGDVANSTDGKEINYWSSVFRDWEEDRSWKGDEWHTLVRLTATIVLDERVSPTDDDFEEPANSGASLTQAAHYDYARAYNLRVQQSNSRYYGSSDYGVDTADDRSRMVATHAVIDEINSQLLHSSHFAFPVIHKGDGLFKARRPRFMPGDCVGEIVGRDIELQSKSGKHAWISQVTYSPETYETTITLNDLRVARVG